VDLSDVKISGKQKITAGECGQGALRGVSMHWGNSSFLNGNEELKKHATRQYLDAQNLPVFLTLDALHPAVISNQNQITTGAGHDQCVEGGDLRGLVGLAGRLRGVGSG